MKNPTKQNKIKNHQKLKNKTNNKQIKPSQINHITTKACCFFLPDPFLLTVTSIQLEQKPASSGLYPNKALPVLFIKRGLV